MSSEYTNTNLNLEILAEEASEVIEALSRVIRMKSKIVRFGLTDHHPKNMTPNNEALEEEIGHFLAMVDILINQGVLSESRIVDGAKKKKETLGLYYQPMGSAPIDMMICRCCGVEVRGRQWKKDKGWGICPECIKERIEEGISAEILRSMYGDEGYHYNIKETK